MVSMATRVRIGSSYLFRLPSHVISRNGQCNCWGCSSILPSDGLAIGKRRGGRGVKRYCLSCAVEKNVVTVAELKKAMKKMKLTEEVMAPILAEVMMFA